MGGGGSQDTTTTTTPWAGQQPYLTDLMREAQGLYRSGVGQNFFPGNTVAPFSPQTQMGLDLMTQRGLYGSPVEQGMQDWVTGTLGQQQLGLGGAAQAAGGMFGGGQAGQNMLMQAGQPFGYGDAAGMAGLGQMDPYQAQLQQIMGGAPDLAAASQFAGGATAPWAQTLQGMTGFGGLGEAQQFAGTPEAGALPASIDTAQRLMQQGIDPQAAATLGQTAGGGFVGSNPYLQDVASDITQQATQAFTEEMAPAIAAQFGAAGRTRRTPSGAGGGIQADVLGGAAEDVTRGIASQLASDVYMPAYEAERGRQQQAAMGLGELGLGAGQLQLGAGGLGGDLFGTQAGADLGRLGLASQQYLGERGLGQQAAQAGGQLGLGGAGLAADLYGTGGQLGLGAAGQGMQNLMGQRGMAADLWSSGLDRQLQAGLGLQQGGLGAIGSFGDLYGQQQQALARAGALAPQAAGLDYQNIDALMRAGALTEDQAQRLIDAEREAYDFRQQAPWGALGQYSGIVQGMPQFGTTTSSGPSGSRMQGGLGGALAGGGLGYMMGLSNPLIGGLALGGGLLGGLFS